MIESDHIKETRAPWDQRYYETLSKIVADVAKNICDEDAIDYTNYRVLDAGCGSGETMASLRELGFFPNGIDVNIDCAKRSIQFGQTVVAQLMSLDRMFPQKYFDLVICSHVLEHMENPKAAIEVLKRICAKTILITVPNLARLANFMIRRPRIVNKGHLVGWDCHHLRTFLEIHCNLKITRWIQGGVTLPPLRNKYFYNSNLLYLLEYKMLPIIMPQQGNSLIVTCET